jgi:hypothetical protein
MKTGKLNIIMVAAALIALSGCSTVSVQQLSEKYDRPILSAAEARAMIRVEVATLEPQPQEPTILASASFDSL